VDTIYVRKGYDGPNRFYFEDLSIVVLKIILILVWMLHRFVLIGMIYIIITDGTPGKVGFFVKINCDLTTNKYYIIFYHHPFLCIFKYSKKLCYSIQEFTYVTLKESNQIHYKTVL
jgi:hypothetical protein